jgi:dTDP-4-dehydrorhamnose 3,5-epimerase-like enzyme|tara:strand:+ start:464 stop:871 length:408 start_codon:yes stop_codon:yes gene_type:complete
MKTIKKIKIKSFFKKNGKLTPFSFTNKFPIAVKRVYFIKAKKNTVRGDHAHKKCSQFFYPINGSMELIIKTNKISKKILLKETSNYGVLVPPLYWCGVKFLNEKSILMVANDKLYQFNDYIEKFSDYIKYINKKK